MKPDEKTCPYCAETIKKAAIKCRYCGSDLITQTTEPTPLPAQPVAAPEAEPVPAAEPEPAPAAPTPGRSRLITAGRSRRGAGGPAVAGALVLVLVVAALACVLVGRSLSKGNVAPDGQVTSSATRSVLLDQASKLTSQVLSYTASSFDKDIAAAGRLMTPSFRQQYADTLAKVRSSVQQRGLSLKANVRAAGVVSATSDEVKVLEFVNQITTAKGSKNRQLDENRVVVTLQKTDAGWRISGMDAF